MPVRVSPTALRRAVLSLALLVLVALPPAQHWTPVVYAASRSWTGNGANNAWTTAQNWSGNIAPSADDELRFPAGGARKTNVNNFPADTRFQSIVFEDEDYKLQGNRVALTGGIASIGPTNQFGNRIDLQIRVLNDQTFRNGSVNALLSVDGAVILDNGSTLQLNEGGDPMGNLSLLGVVSGSGGIITGGPGGILGGNNTYTGITTVDRNPLAIVGSNALGATTAPTNVLRSGVLILDDILVPAGLTVPEPISLLDGGTLFSRRGVNTVSGPVTSGATATRDIANILEAGSGHQLLITGPIAGSRPITKRGAGVVALFGPNTFTESVVVEAGVLQVIGAQALGTTSSSQTRVLQNATLELTVFTVGSGFTLAEPVSLASGASLRNAVGNNVLSGEIAFDPGSQVFSTDGANSLVMSGVLSGGALSSSSSVQLQGTGRYQLTGSQPNTLQTTLAITCGTLELNKPGGVVAAPSNLLILGVGCPGGVRPTARLLSNDQIADTSIVFVGGLFDVGAKVETIAAITGGGTLGLPSATPDTSILRLTGLDPTSLTPPFTGVMTGSGIIRMEGPGQQEIISISPAFDGAISIPNGTLALGGNLANTQTFFSGSGRFNGGRGGALTVRSITGTGGRLSTGDGITTGSIELNPNVVAFFNDVFEASPGVLRVDGAVELNNAVLELDNDGAQTINETALLIDKRSAGPIQGTFAGLPEGAIAEVNGILGRISYQGGNGNDATFTSFQQRCSPRPDVTVQTRQLSASVIEATVVPTNNQVIAGNQLLLMQFVPPPGANAQVTVPVQPGVPVQQSGAGAFTVTMNPPQPILRFTIQQTSAGLPATSFFTAFDRCGKWQSMSGAGKGTFGQVGAFLLEPSAATVTPGEILPLLFRWSVPPPQNWHDLRSLRLRIVGSQGVVLQLRWDEASDAFTVESNTSSPLFDLGQGSTQGSGPTGPTVTLRLPIRALHGATGSSFTLEVEGIDDAGTVQGFEAAGTLTVSAPAAQAAAPAATSTSSPTIQPESDPSPRRLTAEQRQQRRRTDTSSLDDTRTEGALLEKDCASQPPTATIAGMDGSIVLRLHGDAAQQCRDLGLESYVRAEGEKVHELLYEIESIDLD